MDVGGWDEHVGDIVNASFTTIVGPPRVETDIRDRRPINLNLDAGFAFRGSVTYEYPQWGVGAAGWFLGTDDSVSGTVTTPVATADTFFLNFVSFWGEPRGGGINELEPSGVAPEEFRVDQELDTFTAEVFGFRTLAENSSSRIDAIVGVKVGQLETTQNQSRNLRTFIFDDFGPGLHFNNFISLSSTAEAEFLGVGPMVGFSGRATWRQLAFRTFVTQSLLIGDADLEGLFTDIDDGGGGVSRGRADGGVQRAGNVAAARVSYICHAESLNRRCGSRRPIHRHRRHQYYARFWRTVYPFRIDSLRPALLQVGEGVYTGHRISTRRRVAHYEDFGRWGNRVCRHLV